MTVRDVFLVDAVRTPVGKRGGGLSAVHPVDLGAFVLAELVARSGVDPGRVEDVIFGCVGQIGAQASNVARVAWLSAGLPEHVPGVVVDRRCGSGQQAIEFAANGIRGEQHELAVAGGVESMSIVPIGSPAVLGARNGTGAPYAAQGWTRRYGADEPSQFVAADAIARKWGITRGAMEEFALESHRRARTAAAERRFDREIAVHPELGHDEGPRETSLERMAAMTPLLEGGLTTAALASQVSDAACALLLASGDAVDRHGLTPRARIVASAVVGSDPQLILTGPITATPKVLDRAGLSIDDIDLFECNEAFASVVLAWAAETKAPLERTNVNGGAIALGHPLGATGARLVTSLISELERTGGRYGLVTMCEGGGTSNATIVERL